MSVPTGWGKGWLHLRLYKEKLCTSVLSVPFLGQTFAVITNKIFPFSPTTKHTQQDLEMYFLIADDSDD